MPDGEQSTVDTSQEPSPPKRQPGWVKPAKRYAPGELPDTPEAAGLFDVGSSVVEYVELPEADRAPDYPRPDLSAESR